jgi:hypothetical protein
MNLPSNKSISDWYTGCNIDFLKYVGTRSVFYPPEFVSYLSENNSSNILIKT